MTPITHKFCIPMAAAPNSPNARPITEIPGPGLFSVWRGFSLALVFMVNPLNTLKVWKEASMVKKLDPATMADWQIA